MAWDNTDYVDVSDRIKAFYAKYPNGSLQSYVPPFVTEAGGKAFVVYGAAAYRAPDDERPGIGWAWEPVPGPTNFTKDSELQNAETSAWGRAIVALGFETKHVASANEVRNRQGDTPPPARTGNGASNGTATEPQIKNVLRLVNKVTKAGTVDAVELTERFAQRYGTSLAAEWTKAQATEVIDGLEKLAGETA